MALHNKHKRKEETNRFSYNNDSLDKIESLDKDKMAPEAKIERKTSSLTDFKSATNIEPVSVSVEPTNDQNPKENLKKSKSFLKKIGKRFGKTEKN